MKLRIGRMAPIRTDRGLGNEVFTTYLEGITCWKIVSIMKNARQI